jgi:hypothetical protein
MFIAIVWLVLAVACGWLAAKRGAIGSGVVRGRLAGESSHHRHAGAAAACAGQCRNAPPAKALQTVRPQGAAQCLASAPFNL